MRCENYSKITIIVLWGYLFKVTKNVINHQLNTYIESKGIDPRKMSEEERDEHKGAMFQEMYPGMKQNNAMGARGHIFLSSNQQPINIKVISI